MEDMVFDLLSIFGILLLLFRGRKRGGIEDPREEQA